MILDRLALSPAELEAATGWELKPEGLCRDERCVPFPESSSASDTVDMRSVAERLRMPLVHDETHGLWALGPESGGKVLDTAALPDLELSDFEGRPFDFASLRGQKVLIAAWASW